MSNLVIRNVRSGAQVATVSLVYGALSAPPAVQAGVAFFGEGGASGTSLLHAVDCVSGVDLWSPGLTVAGSLDCTPTVIGLQLFAPASNGFLYGFDISDLANPVETFQLNVLNLPAGQSARIAGAILASDIGQLFMVTSQGVYGVSLGPAPAVLWTAAPGVAFSGLLPTMNETLIFASTGATLYAFDTAATPDVHGVLPAAWTAPAGAGGDCGLYTPAPKDVSMSTLSVFWDAGGAAHAGAHPYMTSVPDAQVLIGAASLGASAAPPPPGPSAVPEEARPPGCDRPRVLPMPQFEAGEHVLIGDSVTLKFSAGDPGSKASKVPLALPNGLQLTYGQIAALAADFYGVPEQPISGGPTDAARQDRFLQAFATLATDANAPREVRAVLDIMQIEIDAVAAAVANHQQPSSAYAALPRRDYAWSRVTGGSGWKLSNFNGRYMRLQSENFDHFGSDAIAAYSSGHGAALSVANAARQQSDLALQQAQLQLAYAMNAFADHFLSDLFAGGHIRTPRRQLRDLLRAWGPVTDLLAMYMHNEDCQYGVTVVNARGDQWTAYGDRYYLDDVNAQNKAYVNEAVQASVTEVYSAFVSGTLPGPTNYAALRIIPDLTVAQNYLSNNPPNPAAMFVFDGTRIQRRVHLDDASVHLWTPDWGYAETYASLVARYGAPWDGAAWAITPPPRPPTIDPNGWTSTTPQPPNWVDGNQVRYAVAYANASGSGGISPWSAWTTLSGKYCPTLVDIPVDHLNVGEERRIYRQFSNLLVTQCIGDLENNVATTFVDNRP